MEYEKLLDLKHRVKYRLLDFLRAARLYLNESDPDHMKTSCPFCGQEATILEIPFLEPQYHWSCSFCGKSGDAIQYAMEYLKLTEEQAILKVCRLLGERITFLQAQTAEELLGKEYPPLDELMENLLTPGLFILAGAPKSGKSWLVLQLAHHVSMGIPLWGRQVKQCKVLYLALEDTEQRIQNRLRRICNGTTGTIFFSTEAELLYRGFEDQIRSFLQTHSGIGLVIVDTLAKVREVASRRNAYAEDYATMTVLKNLAQRFHLVLLVVHHTRKQESADIMGMISGTNGLMGCADGAMVLDRPDRLSSEASLNITGRDCEDARLLLIHNKETMCWDCIGYGDEPINPEEAPVLEAVEELVCSHGTWCGTARELVTSLREIDPSLNLQPNALSRALNDEKTRLKERYGVVFSKHRKGNTKLISLKVAEDPTDMYDVSDGFSME